MMMMVAVFGLCEGWTTEGEQGRAEEEGSVIGMRPNTLAYWSQSSEL